MRYICITDHIVLVWLVVLHLLRVGAQGDGLKLGDGSGDVHKSPLRGACLVPPIVFSLRPAHPRPLVPVSKAPLNNLYLSPLCSSPLKLRPSQGGRDSVCFEAVVLLIVALASAAWARALGNAS